jgi:3-oxoacyl-[acyl-carrier-protein] synthase I
MNAAPLVLAAACMFPSGPRIELADTAVRGQLALLRRHPEYFDSAGINVRSSFFPIDIPFSTLRWAALADSVLSQLAFALDRAGAPSSARNPCLLWLVLPNCESRPGIPDDLVEALTSSLERSAFHWEHIEIRAGGHATGVAALRDATDALASRPNALAVVMGVESGLSCESLMWLDMQSLLHGAHRPYQGGFRGEPYGRVPGEGAAAIAITGHATGAERPWAQLLGASTADEPITHSSGGVCTGAGLTRAAMQAFDLGQEYSPKPIGRITVDLNGEPYRADQFGFAALRLAKRLTPHWQRVVPALASGDLNSASAIAHVALAAYENLRRPRHATHLVLASSDDPLRGAVLLGSINPISPLQEIRPWRSPSTSMA